MNENAQNECACGSVSNGSDTENWSHEELILNTYNTERWDEIPKKWKYTSVRKVNGIIMWVNWLRLQRCYWNMELIAWRSGVRTLNEEWKQQYREKWIFEMKISESADWSHPHLRTEAKQVWSRKERSSAANCMNDTVGAKIKQSPSTIMHHHDEDHRQQSNNPTQVCIEIFANRIHTEMWSREKFAQCKWNTPTKYDAVKM
jgi:hypothetical protein